MLLWNERLYFVLWAFFIPDCSFSLSYEREKSDTKPARFEISRYFFLLLFWNNKKLFRLNNGTQNHINSFRLLSVNSWNSNIIKLLSLMTFFFLDSWIWLLKLTYCWLVDRADARTNSHTNFKFFTDDTPIEWFMVNFFRSVGENYDNEKCITKMMLYKIYRKP